MDNKSQYLLRIQYLGFRYSGWQHQPGEKTLESMLEKTMHFILPGRKFKFLGSGRTDARVSALDFAVQFILWGEPIAFTEAFLQSVNENLPADICLKSVQKAPPEFNAIKDCSYKSYRYYFTTGNKPHPFCAPFMAYFSGDPDLEVMGRTAPLFEGTHDFSSFITRASPAAYTRRTVEVCRLERNLEFRASFFPDTSYFLEVGGTGFGRYQVRNMITALVALGRGEVSVGQIQAALASGEPLPIRQIAPASGLHLMDVQFEGVGF